MRDVSEFVSVFCVVFENLYSLNMKTLIEAAESSFVM